MPQDTKLFLVQETIALQPDGMKLSGPELEISPVRLQRNGLAGEITFRAPAHMGLDEIIPMLIGMLTSTPVAQIEKKQIAHQPDS